MGIDGGRKKKRGAKCLTFFFMISEEILNNGIANRNKAERNSMENRIKLYDFHLFDGEGAGAEASTAGSEQTQKPKVEYGKSTGNSDPAPSQVGSDNGNEADDRIAKWNAIKGDSRTKRIYRAK